MKSHKNILVAFVLNLSFSIFELFGGISTNSISVISDAVHDFGDALSIGISFFLEKKSKKKPDNVYTFGYARYSVFGAFITNSVLITGSVLVIVNAVKRLINPQEIDYDGMLIFAIFGVIINLAAAFLTHKGESLNQKAVSLHMLEDVLGWLIVLVGAITIKFTKITIIDPIMSIGMASFISINAVKGFRTCVDLFAEKIPKGINTEEIAEHIRSIEGVSSIHHIHIWSMDGVNNLATMHIVTNRDKQSELKTNIKNELKEHGIAHSTIEFEEFGFECDDTECHANAHINTHHHH